MAAAHDPYAALRSPDYRRLLTGNVLSALGSTMQSVAVDWELYEFVGQLGQTREIPSGRAHLDYHVPAFYVSQLAKTLEDRVEVVFAGLEQDPNPPGAARR